MRWPTLPPYLRNKKTYPRGAPHTHPAVADWSDVPEWPVPNEGCTTLTQNLRYSVEKFGDRPCMGYRPIEAIREEERIIEGEPKMWNVTYFGETRWFTYSEIWARLIRVGDGFKRLTSLTKGGRIMIYENTRLEWFLVAHGAWRHGFVVSTAYANLGLESLLYSINKIEATVVFCNGANVRKLIENESAVPSLRYLVYVDDLPEDLPALADEDRFRLISLEDVEKLGTDEPIPEDEVEAPTRDDVCVIMFTSGSTGDPKGVVIRHRSLVAGTSAARKQLQVDESTAFISYLPLAHILEMEAENAVLFVGGSLGFGNPQTLVDRAAEPMGDIKAFRPTIMLGVPRVWDTVKKGIYEKVAGFGGCAQGMFRRGLAKKRASIYTNRSNPFWNALVFNKFKREFGGRLQILASGAAPLTADSHELMVALFDVPFTQGYGLTEVCGACLGQEKDEFGTGNCGYPITPCMIKLVDCDELGYLTTDEPLERGEVCVTGPIVSDGYFEMPEKTAEDFVVGEDGLRWFHTGDIGQWNANGTMSIIDRKKNLVKLSGGEYVAVLGLESAYISNSPFVAPNGVFIYADSTESTIVAMVVPQRSYILDWADRHSLERNAETLIENPRLLAAILESLDQVAFDLGFRKFEFIQKIALTLDNWEEDPFLMTASRKLRRKNARERYQDSLARLYEQVHESPRRVRVNPAIRVRSTTPEPSTEEVIEIEEEGEVQTRDVVVKVEDGDEEEEYEEEEGEYDEGEYEEEEEEGDEEDG